MKTIKAKPITVENFAPYGSFTSIVEPSGNALGNFYNDKVLLPVSGSMPVAFSPLVMDKPDKMIISEVEYHNTTGEGILPVDDDVVMHVAPPGKEPVPELTEAFIVPKGTVVKINTGVWHMGVLPLNREQVHVLIVLPERIYMNDCTVVTYQEEDQMEIVL